MSVLTPTRLAAAAPANEPLGIAWATNAEPRSTTKKPTAPPTTATIVATIQALTMNPENTQLTCGRIQSAGSRPREISRDAEVGEQDQRDDEEADRPAVVQRRPVVAVVGEQDPEPHRADPDRAGGDDRAAGTAGERSAVAAGPTSSAVDRIAPIVTADKRDRERHREQVERADQPDREPRAAASSGLTDDQQQRPVEREQRSPARRRRTTATSGSAERDEREDRPEQDRDRRAGRALSRWCRGTGTARPARSRRRARSRSRGRGRGRAGSRSAP